MSHAWRHLKHSLICKSAAPLLFYRLYGNTPTPKRVALFHQGPVDVYVGFCWSICSAGCQAHVNVGTSQNPRALVGVHAGAKASCFPWVGTPPLPDTPALCPMSSTKDVERLVQEGPVALDWGCCPSSMDSLFLELSVVTGVNEPHKSGTLGTIIIIHHTTIYKTI